MELTKRICCAIILIILITYILLGSYLSYTIAESPQIPEGAITPSIHTVDKITIDGEKIYYNGTLQEGKVINLTVGHQTKHKLNSNFTKRSLIGLVLRGHRSNKTNGTNGSLAVWDNVNITSFGRTIKNAQGQQWFTAEHTHNPGASYNSWRDQLPLFGQVPTENLYVNKKNEIQTEVGIDYISINVTGNTAKEVYTLTVAQIHRELSFIWLNYFISIPVLSLLLFYVQYSKLRLIGGVLGQDFENTQLYRTAKWWSFNKLMLYGSAGYEFIEFFKDVIYLVYFPHTSHFNVYVLLLALFINLVVFAIILYNRHINYSSTFIENIRTTCLGLNVSGSSSNSCSKCAKAIYMSAIHLVIFYHESFELAYTWKRSQYLFPVISLISIVISIAKLSTSSEGARKNRKWISISLGILLVALYFPTSRIFSEFTGTQQILDQYALRNPKLTLTQDLLVSFWTLPVILVIYGLYLCWNWKINLCAARLRFCVLWAVHESYAKNANLKWEIIEKVTIELIDEDLNDIDQCKQLKDRFFFQLDLLIDEEDAGKFYDELLRRISQMK